MQFVATYLIRPVCHLNAGGAFSLAILQTAVLLLVLTMSKRS